MGENAFGLKNAPLVYQAVINNCLWGFVRLSPEEEKLVDSDVLEFLNLDQARRSTSRADQEVPILTDHMTVFKRNIPAPPQMGPVLGRSSYIDDIAHGAPTWDQLCDDLNTLLYRLRYWNISISAEGIRAIPKIAKSVQDLPFPSTLKGVQSFLGSLNYYHKFIEDFPVIAAVLYELTDEQIKAGRDLTRAKEAFEILKRKIVSTPLLRHPDRTRPFVIIPHANPWAACAVLGQEYDGVIHPVRFTGRVLNESETRYHAAEKEVVAVMRVFDVFEALIRDCPIKVYTSILAVEIQKCVRWGLILSHWDLEVCKVQRDEDGLAAVLGAGITPREHLDEIAECLIPAKGRVKPPPVISVEVLEEDFKGYVLSFDGAAKTSTRQGSWGCIIWELPGWRIVSAQGFPLEDVTVNDAEYHGLLKGLILVSERGISEIVVVGDSRIVIQQAQGLINCNQPNLQRRLAEYAVLKEKFKSIQLVHVKRDYNQAADYLTSKTLALGEAWTVSDPAELMHLEQVSMIPEKIMKPVEIPRKKATEALVEEPPAEVMKYTHPGTDSAPLPAPVRVMAAITRSQHRQESDQQEPMGPVEYQAERWRRIKAQQDGDSHLMNLKKFLRGDSEDFSRPQIRRISKEAELFVLDVRGVGRPIRVPPQETSSRQDRLKSYPWISSHISQSPNEGIHLLFQDMFSGYVMCKPMSSTTAQDVAEACEERVFQRFGASSMIHHDQDPRFMSEFKCFRDLLGSKQRATLGYRPQANGQQERSVQTVIRSVRAYVAEADQSDWDDHAERLMFALNTSFDATRLDTPFYLVHGWDAQSTILAMLGPKPSNVPERTAYEWRRRIQRDYGYAQACAEDQQRKAKRERAAIQTQKWKELSERVKAGYAVGDAVWLYIPKVQPGLSRKLAHLWHGPFRIIEVRDDFRVKLKVEDTGYRVNPWSSEAASPVPTTTDFAIQNNEYEVEKILDLRWSKRTRTSKRIREYLIKWKGYDEPEWLPVSQLSCGALLYEFNQGAKARARFQTMQAGEDHPRL
ncbi:reverse transcriptase [Phytophthora palmivora]|uniref:Reverse transcriptase n=1 Tax=Phytophthora palmivora TaxID=4796 RepID=A0A2P4X142_9STRA|nr:reverse transcriptase [Phytophthora palmivora]